MTLLVSGMPKPEAGDADGFSDYEARLKPPQRLTGFCRARPGES